MTKRVADDRNPPRWMNRILRSLVSPGEDGPIEGDLLEEYGEEVLPRSGRFRANLWYLSQVLSFVRFSRRAVVVGMAWIACAACLLPVGVNSILVRAYDGDSLTAMFILVGTFAIVLNAMGALRSIRVATILRNGLVFGAAFGLVLGVRFVRDTLVPPGLFSTLGRDIEIGMLLVGILLAAGIWGGWRLGQFRGDVLVVLAAGAIGWVVSLVAIAIVALCLPRQFAAVLLRNEEAWTLGLFVSLWALAQEFVRTAALLGRGLQGFAPERSQMARPR
jgi:hypothetical protein